MSPRRYHATQIESKAKQLVANLIEKVPEGAGAEWISPSVYDAAWLSMLAKTENGATKWLFPECFEFVQEQQLRGGAWPSYGTHADAIINTMMAILAFNMHIMNPDYFVSETIGERQWNKDLEARLQKGKNALETLLQNWDVEATVNAGFELIVYKLLDLLDHEGFQFAFEGLTTLKALHDMSFDQLSVPAILSGDKKTPLLYFLETFVGDLDMDEVSHHLSQSSSMMGSPAATATYHLYSVNKNTDAENGLIQLVAISNNGIGGRVPNAFPTSIFVPTVVTTTLLGAGFSMQALGEINAMKMSEHLATQLNKHGGVVGSAPELLPNVGDTARTVLALNLLSRPSNRVSPDALIATFGGLVAFRTFEDAPEYSFSANCHVLECILASPDPGRYIEQISRVVQFICDRLDSQDHTDTLNLCVYYTYMLVAQNLKRLRETHGGAIQFSLPSKLTDRLPRAATIVTEKILDTKVDSSAWSWPPGARAKSVEATAYCVLAIWNLRQLPWTKARHTDIEAAISQGSNYITDNGKKWTEGEYYWVGKTTFRSGVLCEAFCLAAIWVAGTIKSALDDVGAWDNSMVR